MNFKLFIFVIVLVGIQSSNASEFDANFFNVQDDFKSSNNFLDIKDGEDVSLKNIKELNFDAYKIVKLAGREYRESNCEGSENLCKTYKANLVKCVNRNYRKNSTPAFKCSIVDADNVDEDLEINNATVACNNPKNKLPGYIRTPCVFRYQFKFKEDDEDILMSDLEVLNFDSSRIVKLVGREKKQAECEGDKNLCQSVNVQLIKCHIKSVRCEIKSAENMMNGGIEIDNPPKLGCNPSPAKKGHVRPPCTIIYKLKIKN